MTTSRWQTVQDLFHSVLQMTADERTRFLDESGADDDVRYEVLALIDAHDSEASFMESSPADSVARLLVDEPSETLVGSRIGSFTVERLIGAGGMGAVFAAQQDRPHRTVALKVMRTGIASRPALRRFADEAEILGRLRHAGVAQVHEAGTFDDGSGARPYFAMEFVPDARSITAYADEHDLGVRGRLDLILQVCRAVEHGHQRGVIHRDLKPGNLLVDAAGTVKVIDFGVARATDADLAVSTLRSEARELVGTIAYMSPEQCAARPDAIDVRSDVYAVGAVLYELLASTPPIDVSAGGIPQALRRICEIDAAPLGSVDRAYAGDLETIAQKALEKSPDQRYQSIAALAADLERFLRHEPIMARPHGASYHLRKFVRRHVGLVTMAGVAAAILVVASIVSIGLAISSKRAEQSANASQARFQRRFDESWNVAHAMLFDLHDAIADLEGATDARHLLVDTARGYLADLASEVEDEPELERELAAAWIKLGDIQGGTSQANLGDTPAAISSYTAAETIVDDLAARGHADAALLAQRSNIALRFGDVLAKTGEMDHATARYRESVALRADLSAAAPDDLDAARQLAVARSRLGRHIGDADSAGGLAELERAAELFQRIVEATPEQSRSQRDAAVVQNRLASILARTGRTAEAIERRRLALAAYEALHAQEPDSGSIRRSLQRTHLVLGRLLTFGNLEEGIVHLRAAYDHAEAMHAADESNALARRDLATACDDLANALGNPNFPNLGDYDGALALYERSLELRTALVAADPNHLIDRRNLATEHTKLGDVYLAQGATEQAAEAFDAALAVIDDALAPRPEHVRLRQTRISVIQRVGDALRKAGEPEASIPRYRAALADARALVAADPISVLAKQQMTVVMGKLGYALEKTGGYDEAEAMNREALAIRAAVSAADPASEYDKRNVAVSCDNVARLALIRAEDEGTPEEDRRAHLETSRTFYERSLAVFDELAVEGRQRASDAGYIQEIRDGLARAQALLAGD